MADLVETVASQTIGVATSPEGEGEIDEVLFWNPATEEFQATVPTVFLGQDIGVRVHYVNSSTVYRMTMYLNGVVTGPSGIESSQDGDSAVFIPGTGAYVALMWVADLLGTYSIVLSLYSEFHSVVA